MLVQLSPLQARVIGVLIEKEITTPDQYPLSLNALCLGCNQKSSREPVMSLSESEVQEVLDELKSKHLLFEEMGSRTSKYKHRFCNTEFSDFQFCSQQLALICLLLLRGPQTPGELRTRSKRLCEFANVEEVEHTLDALADFGGEKLVIKLAREPGRREARYAHLYSGQDFEQSNTTHTDINSKPAQDSSSVFTLDQALARIETLEQQMQDVKNLLDDLTS